MECPLLSALRSSPWDRLGPKNGPDQDRSCQDRGPGPSPSDLLEERLEKTAVLGLVRTGLGPNRDGNRVDLIFLYILIFFSSKSGKSWLINKQNGKNRKSHPSKF